MIVERRALGSAGTLLLGMLVTLGGCTRAGGNDADAGATLTLASDSASNPTVAWDARSGRTYVAWVGVEDGHSAVLVAAVEAASGAMAPPVRANDIPGDAAPHAQAPAQVAVGPEGNVYVLWQNNTPVDGRRFPASDLRLAVSTDGARTFRPAVTVNDDAGGPPSSHTFHDLAVAADGTVLVSWIDSRERDAVIHQQVAGAMSGAGMGADVHAHHSGMAESALLATGGDAGRHSPGDSLAQLVAAHHDHAAGGSTGPQAAVGKTPASPAAADPAAAPSGPEIRVARSQDAGATFSRSVVVDSASCPCCRTSLALGPDGAVYVAWRKIFPGDVRDVVVARAEPGTLKFGSPVRVHEDDWVFPGCPHAGPSLAIDLEGRLLVGWYTGKEGRQGLWYAASEDGGRSFGNATPMLTADWVPPSQLRLAISGQQVWAAWDDQTGDSPVVRMAAGRAGETLKPLEGEGGVGRDPALVATAEGAVVAWLDGEAVRARWVQ